MKCTYRLIILAKIFKFIKKYKNGGMFAASSCKTLVQLNMLMAFKEMHLLQTV